MDKKTIEVALKLKDQLTGELGKVASKSTKALKELEDQTKKTKEETGGLAGIAVKAAKAIAGMHIVKKVGQFMIGAAQAAENYNRQLRALEFQTGRVGVSAEKLISDLQRVTQGQVSQIDLVLTTNRAIALIGNDAIPQMSKLAEAAMKASQVMGIDVAQAMDNLAIGIGRQSRLILDNLGVIISITDANENYAKTLGKTVDELTEAEKKTGFLLEVTTQLDKKFGDLDITLSATDGLRASIKDLKKDIGEGLLPVYEKLLFITNSIIQLSRMPGIFLFTGAGGKTKEEIEARYLELTQQGTNFEKQTEFMKQRMHGAQSGMFLGSLIDKSQIQMVDDLTAKHKELAETLRLLQDPEVNKWMDANDKLNKQINNILNPTIDKAKKKTKEWWEINREWAGSVNRMRTALSDFIGVYQKYITLQQSQYRNISGTGAFSSLELIMQQVGFSPRTGFRWGGGGVDAWGQHKTKGQTGAEYRQQYQQQLTGIGISAFQNIAGGGGVGQSIAGALPALGGAVGGMGTMTAAFGAFGGPVGMLLGGIAGSLLGGLFGKKRRGTTPAEPVYTSDVNLHNSMTELLNAVKSNLAMSAGSGINRISGQLKAQALAQGAI